MKEIYIKVDNSKVRFHKWGDSKNPTIICLHGLGSTSLSFIELGDLLQNRYQIISIDLPGHGKTPQFLKEEDYEMPNITKWLDKVIHEITDEKFYLLAHSWGADIALHYLSTHPLNIIKTMLLDGGYYLKNDCYAYQASILGEIDSLQSEIEYYIRDFDEYCFNSIQEHIDTEKSNYERWSTLLEEATKDLVRVENNKYKYHANGYTAASALKSMYYYPPDIVYDKVPSSIYLLRSTLPKSMNEHRKILANKFKTRTLSKVKLIDEAGHMIHWDKPNEVAEEILKWFE